MSISMERFGMDEQRPEPLGSNGLAGPSFPYRLQCRTCGFEPQGAIIPPSRCPKCASHSWERFAFPGSALLRSDDVATGRPATR
jgi:hypothetical protein